MFAHGASVEANGGHSRSGNSSARSCAGYTLYTPEPHTAPDQGLVLVDMEGNVVRSFPVRGHVGMLPDGSVIGEPLFGDVTPIGSIWRHRRWSR